ncbi:MAG: metallophosphoesterase [Clostridia bacterium]|nr:metallophosphoesterase [Clostridia bacterium]
MKKRIISFFLCISLLACLVPIIRMAETARATETAETESTVSEVGYSNISVNIGSNYSEMNFIWHYASSEAGTLYIARTADLADGEMPENALTFKATATMAKNGVDYYNKASARGLFEDTEYSYQIVTDGVKSEIYTFKTGSSDGAFTFVFAGDPQVGQSGAETDRAKWAASLDAMEKSEIFDDASFMVVLGDHVSSAGTEEYYDAYLDHEYLYNLPTVDVIGNHDSYNGVWKDHDAVFYEHFTLPNEGAMNTCLTMDAGGDSWFVYNDVLFMNLNTNHYNHVADYKHFMKNAIEANPTVSWKVVMFHHSIYSVSSNSNKDYIINLRNALVPVLEELDIDVVLMGHDHVYCRTYMMDGFNPIIDSSLYDDPNYLSVTDPEGILYVTANSASGTKYYDFVNTLYPYAAVQNQEKVPNISKVHVSDTQFAITTYRLTDMSIVDTFAINRTAEDVDTEAANAMRLISFIGEADDFGAANIAAAREAYDALDDEKKELVSNYDVLLDAEYKLENKLDANAIVTSGYSADIGIVYPETESYVHINGRDRNIEGAVWRDDTEGKYTEGTSYTVSFKARTLPFVPSSVISNNPNTPILGMPSLFRVGSYDWANQYLTNVPLTSEWTEFSFETTAFDGTLWFFGSSYGYGFAPMDVKDIRIVETGKDENLAINTAILFDGTAGWTVKDNGGDVRALTVTPVSGDMGHFVVPSSTDTTAFTFTDGETLAAGKYTVSGDFRLDKIDYNKYDCDLATLYSDANTANLTLGMDTENVAVLDAENFKSVTFTIDSESAFAKNDIVFTLDGAATLGVKNLEVTLIESYEPEIEKFDLSGVTMTLGSSLSLDFAIDTSKLTGTDNYAKMTIVYADGRPSDTIIVPQSEWTVFSGTIYTAKFTGMAAKQMNDVVSAVICNADGQALTNEKSDSIETYAVRMLNGNAANNAKLRAVYVDMLNYGAAAQEQFDYDVENLANRNLTASHQAWATAFVETTDNRVKGTGYAGSTLTLAGEIQLDLVFTNTAVGSDYSKLYAVATYTDHYGNSKEVRIEGADFIKYSSTLCQVSITGMAVADFRSVVSCTVYNADGAAVANASDSVESYASRNAASLGATVDTIVKFGESSYNYFH